MVTNVTVKEDCRPSHPLIHVDKNNFNKTEEIPPPKAIEWGGTTALSFSMLQFVPLLL